MSAKFQGGRVVEGNFVAVFSLPLMEVLELQQRFGGDKEDASKLLDALMDGIYATFPDFPRDRQQGGKAQE